MSDPDDLGGIHLDRRGALALGARMAGLLTTMSAASTFLGLGGCAQAANTVNKDHRPLVLVLSAILLPASATPGAGNSANADFVARAVNAGLMGVPADALDKLAAELDKRAGGEFLKRPPAEQTRIIEELDKATFMAGAPRPAPWFPTKALILMSYYTSEAGMSQELRYELAPGRYDPDLIIDKSWRPLSNDWIGVAIRKGITG
ncbi:hypothetical protein BH10PSE12_BH10PSE12_17630 [soil metagenome]